MRNKNEILNLIKKNGFNPDLIIDIGAAAGTDGLYGVWEDSHHILVDILEHFTDNMRKNCNNLKSAEFHVNAVGSSNSIVYYSYDPLRPHSITFQKNIPTGSRCLHGFFAF